MYKVNKNAKGKFELIELATEQIIGTFNDHATAKKKYNAYKGGQAFNGWTPSFMLIEFPVVYGE